VTSMVCPGERVLMDCRKFSSVREIEAASVGDSQGRRKRRSRRGKSVAAGRQRDCQDVK